MSTTCRGAPGSTAAAPRWGYLLLQSPGYLPEPLVPLFSKASTRLQVCTYVRIQRRPEGWVGTLYLSYSYTRKYVLILVLQI